MIEIVEAIGNFLPLLLLRRHGAVLPDLISSPPTQFDQLDMVKPPVASTLDKGRVEIGSKVLLIAQAHTGNNVFCTPAIRFLKKHYPQTRFDIVALNKRSAEVFEGNSDIENIIVLNHNRALKRISRNYASVICLSPQSQALVEGVTQNLIQVPNKQKAIHRADHILEKIAELTNNQLDESDRQYHIHANKSLSEFILNKIKTGTDEILIVMHLGSGRTSVHGWKFFYKNRAVDKRLWPLEKFIETGKILVAKNPNTRILITGTPNETFLGKQFQKAVPGTINLIGKTSVQDIMGLLSRSDLFISQDTGVLHIASATQVPVLALFGPTDVVDTGPYPMTATRVVLKRHHMAEIEATEVAQEAIRLLGSKGH